MGIFFFLQLPRSLPKFLTRLPIFPVFVLIILLLTDSVFQTHTSFLIIAYWGIVIKVMCQNCLIYLNTIVKGLTLSKIM